MGKNAMLVTTLRRMFNDGAMYGRARPLRACKPPVRLADLIIEVNFLLRAGVVGERGETWKAENWTFEELYKREGSVGRAVALERNRTTVGAESSVPAGEYVVVRGEARPEGKAAIVLRKV